MADRHVGKPKVWIKRIIAGMSFPTDEDRRHVTIWADDYLETISTDPRHQASAQSAVWAYAQLVAVESKAVSVPVGTDEHEALVATAIKLQARVDKALRTNAVATLTAQQRRQAKTGDIFTAPRGRQPSELEAEGGDGMGGEAA